jgi:hypothetical protein
MEHENIPFANAMVVPVQLDAVLFPNPVIDQLNIKIYSEGDDVLSSEILNANGAVLSSREFGVKHGENTYSIPLERPYAPGLYFLHLRLNDNTQNVLKFVVE